MGENATKSMSKFDYASWSAIVQFIAKSIIVVPIMVFFITALFAKDDVKKINHPYNYRQTLKIAAKDCNLRIVKFLVEKIVDTYEARLALQHAAEGGCLKIVQFLAGERVDINTTQALHYAAEQGNLEVVKFLLQKGADPNKKGMGRRTPRDFAVMMSRHNKGSNKPYREIINLLYDAEKRYKSEK